MLRGRLDDARVRLMRNEEIDVGAAQLRGVERAVGCFAHLTHGVLEHFASRHLDQMCAVLENLGRHRMCCAAIGTVQQVREISVAAKVRRENSRALTTSVALEHHRARAITEQNAGGAILPIDDCAHLFSADDERSVDCA